MIRNRIRSRIESSLIRVINKCRIQLWPELINSNRGPCAAQGLGVSKHLQTRLNSFMSLRLMIRYSTHINWNASLSSAINVWCETEGRPTEQTFAFPLNFNFKRESTCRRIRYAIWTDTAIQWEMRMTNRLWPTSDGGIIIHFTVGATQTNGRLYQSQRRIISGEHCKQNHQPNCEHAALLEEIAGIYTINNKRHS